MTQKYVWLWKKKQAPPPRRKLRFCDYLSIIHTITRLLLFPTNFTICEDPIRTYTKQGRSAVIQKPSLQKLHCNKSRPTRSGTRVAFGREREKTSATVVTARIEPRQKRSFFSWCSRQESNPNQWFRRHCFKLL